MTLNVASSQQQPVNNTITFNLTDGCNNGVSTDYKFYDVTVTDATGRSSRSLQRALAYTT